MPDTLTIRLKPEDKALLDQMRRHFDLVRNERVSHGELFRRGLQQLAVSCKLPIPGDKKK